MVEEYTILNKTYTAYGIYKLSRYVLVCHDCRRVVTSYDDYGNMSGRANEYKRRHDPTHNIEIIDMTMLLPGSVKQSPLP